MKNTHLLLIVAAALSQTVFAQQKNADLTTLTGFQQTIKLNSKIKPDDVFTVAQNWFNANSALFTAKNAEPPSDVKLKNKNAVEEAYGNSRPLQSLDPAGNRIIGLGLIKYFGGTRSSIRMLYIKYDVVVEIKPGQAAFRISNVRYYHFDQKNYTDAGIYSFTGGKPCDNTGTMEYLIGCQSSPQEFNILADFFQQTAKAQARAFITELQAKKMLPVPAAKPVAKKAVSTKPAVLQAGMKH